MRSIESARPARSAGPCTGYPSPSRTTFTPRTCRPPVVRWRLLGYVPPYEATLTKNLRDAGAIIIAKAGLTELANWVAGAPNPMPGNYNAVGGFAFNPYDPRMDPRDATFDGRPALSTGGSSSGIGTAANLWAASVGTDTGGSVISPSNANMLVGIRPTIGRISRYGVIPITADHDTAGPMTRTVADAAMLFGALESAARRSQRCGDPDVHAATRARLYEVSQRRVGSRARASAFPARFTTTGSRSQAKTARAAGSMRSRPSSWRRPSPCSNSRARSWSIRPMCRASSTRMPPAIFCAGTIARAAEQSQGQGSGLLRQLQVRHEA